MDAGTGVLERVIGVPMPVERVPDEEIEEIVDEVSSALAANGLPSGVVRPQVDRIRSRPREKLRLRKIRFDDDAGLAGIREQNPEDFGSWNATPHLLTIGGTYLAQMEFDHPSADFTMPGGTLYALWRDPVRDLVTLMAREIGGAPGLLDRVPTLVWVPAVPPPEYGLVPACGVDDGPVTGEIFPVAHWVEMQYLSEIHQAWQTDLDRLRLVPIPAEGLRCYDESCGVE